MLRFGGTNDGCNQGLFASHTRYALCGVWAHWARRALAILLGLALLIGLLPSRALAYANRQEVILSDQVATIGDERGVGYMVIAYNAFNAALLALGYSTTDSRLTNDVRARLSNAATGGDFYVFSQSFKTQAQLLGELPAWTFGARDFIDMWETTAGSGTVGPYMDIFYSTVLPDLPPSAKRDLDTVLNGGDLGGGGSGGGLVQREVTFVQADWSTKYGNLPQYVTDGGTVTVAFTGSLLTKLDDLKETYENVAYYGEAVSGNKGYYITLYVIYSNNEITINRTNATVTAQSGQWVYVGDAYLKSDTTTFSTYKSQYSRNSMQWYYGQCFKGGQDVTPTPPNNWPDPPNNPTPTPPTVPDPPTDTPVTQPTPPTDPMPPTYPITTIYEGDTYVVADIAAILDAMDEHCQHLQQAIYNASSDLYESLSEYLQEEFQATRQEIRDDFGWLGGCIHDEFEGLMDYMKELAEWLAEQFDFSFTGDTYNDSTVVSWLKRIYLKLGGGEVNTRPTDPVADPKGIGKWLQDLWNNFLIDLVAIGSNGLGAVAEELQKLTTKFPFSIPWDIAALLALLSASPVAPTVDVPMWSLDSGYQLVRVQDMHIDMSVYNVYWEPVRIIEKIGFAVYLAMRTKDFMELLGLSSAKE